MALSLLGTMGQQNVERNTISCSSAISACEKSKEWQMALLLLDTMGLEKVERNIGMLRLAGEDVASHLTLSAMHFAALSTKHPGFSEEREWRVIYTPKFSLTGSRTSRLEGKIVTLGGVPQRIFALKLENVPEEGFLGATLPELLIEVIIGPTQFPWPIYDALVEKLQVAGVADAQNKVRVSNIPLRR